jgi:hypothetical protein
MKKTKDKLGPGSENPLKTAPIDERIRARAYEIFQASGGVNGRELDHWLEAKREIKGADENRSQARNCVKV